MIKISFEKKNKKVQKEKIKHMETSKKILLASYTSAIILTLIVIVGCFMRYDMTNVTTITTLVWGEVAVSNAFYYKKAQKENVPKVLSNLSEKFVEQVDINQLLNN